MELAVTALHPQDTHECSLVASICITHKDVHKYEIFFYITSFEGMSYFEQETYSLPIDGAHLFQVLVWP